MDKARVQSWEQHHVGANLAALSGCQYRETLDALYISDLLKKGCKVLEVGVGLGYVVQGLRENGYFVCGFDISLTGLERLADYCDRIYNFDELEQIPSDYFDVIICNNVVQHIPTPSLYYEMFHFIRSLKKDGILAVESISSNLMEDTGDDPELVIHHPQLPGGELKCGGDIGCFCRTETNFIKLIDRCGGIAKVVHKEPRDVWFISGMEIYHITKKYKESVYA